jgi:hypothetical protein
VTVATFDDLDPYSAGVMAKIADGAFRAWSLARPPERLSARLPLTAFP